MKLFDNNVNQKQNDKKEEHRLLDKVRGYIRNLFTSKKCKNMPHGSYHILRSMSWARGENWRCNHPKSLNKRH